VRLHVSKGLYGEADIGISLCLASLSFEVSRRQSSTVFEHRSTWESKVIAPRKDYLIFEHPVFQRAKLR